MVLKWLLALAVFFAVALVIFAFDLVVQLYRTTKQRRLLFAAAFHLFEGEHYNDTKQYLLMYLQVSFKEHLICNLDHVSFTTLYDQALIDRYHNYKGL